MKLSNLCLMFSILVGLSVSTLARANSGDFICHETGWLKGENNSKLIQEFLNQNCDKTKPFSMSTGSIEAYENDRVCCIQK